MAKYPDPRSASIPALHAVQQWHGWCSPTAIEQAACVMRLTPAYLVAVATFYDMFDTVPTGEQHDLRVHEHLLLAAWGRRRLRSDARGRGRRPELQRARLRMPGGVRHRADGVSQRRVRRPADDRRLQGDRGRRCARVATCCPTSSYASAHCRRRCRWRSRGREAVLRGHRPSRPQHHGGVREGRRLQAAAQGAQDGARGRACPSSRRPACAGVAAPASRWARRSPSCPRGRWTSTSSATPTSPSPAPSRTGS